MTIFGNWKNVPSRKTGVPAMLKNRFAASAEASFSPVSMVTAMALGMGTMKIKNANGKLAAAIHRFPRKRNPPAARRQTNDRVINAK